MKLTKLTKRNTPAMALVIAPTAIISIIVQVVLFLLRIVIGGGLVSPFPFPF